ncbi:MAG: L-aspartate oxidase [Campylobacterota bacterium]
MVDVLVIGSGGAALSCAIGAHKKGLRVCIASKTPPTWSQTSQAQGGINAAISSTDSVQSHIDDTLKAGGGLAQKSMVTKLCEEAGESIVWLDGLGVPFDKTDTAQFAQRSLGGASHKRALYSQDFTGLKIMHTLFANAAAIERFDSYFLAQLLVKEGTCYGALFLDTDNDRFETIRAKQVVLATGGFGSMYHGYSTNSAFATGDGIACALQAGCKLRNMEMVQFHPTALKTSKTLISESARGEGGYLINDKNERFVDELRPRDEVARAIAKQLQEGREVFLDIRHLGKDVIENLMPQEYRLAKFYEGVDAEDEPIPITPAAHYSMGGIAVDEHFGTQVKDLYALGECSEASVHGANRLGGNSLLEVVTFGRLLGESLEDTGQKESVDFDIKAMADSILNRFSGKPQNSPLKVKKSLGALMFENVGVFKTQTKLRQAQKQLPRLATQLQECRAQSYFSISKILEAQNLLLLAEQVIEAAARREENTGAHYKEAT